MVLYKKIAVSMNLYGAGNEIVKFNRLNYD